MNTPEPASSQTLQFLREQKCYFAIAEELQNVYAEKKLLKFIAFSPASVFIELQHPLNEKETRSEFVKIRINTATKQADIGCRDKECAAEVQAHYELLDSVLGSAARSEWFRQIEHESVMNALAQADYIAKLGANCAPGDNYELGYYDKIQVNEGMIFVRQENHYNAKSLQGTEFRCENFR